MNGKRYISEQIIHKLREAKVELGKGATVPVACKKLGGRSNQLHMQGRSARADAELSSHAERAPCGRIRTLTVMR